MAKDSLKQLDDRLKQAIQTLFTIQSHAHGYTGPETQQELIRQISSLQPTLASLSSRQLPQGLPSVPPEALSYIESGRNPDIYTREFIELVLRSNAYVSSKRQALADFRDVLADEIINGLGGAEDAAEGSNPDAAAAGPGGDVAAADLERHVDLAVGRARREGLQEGTAAQAATEANADVKVNGV